MLSKDKKMFMRTFVAIILIFFSYGVLAQDEISKISLEDIYKARKFSTKGAGEIHSMNDGEHFSQIKNDSLNIYDYETGKLFLSLGFVEPISAIKI